MSEIIYGLHAVKKMLQLSPEDCVALHCLQSRNRRLQQVISLAQQKQLDIIYDTREHLNVLAGNDKHQGCVLEVRAGHKKAASLKELLQNLDRNDLFLVLDGVQDPHNLGACLRTADAAGVNALIVPRDRAVGMTPVVKKVAAGAAESVPLITVPNLARSLKDMQQAGVWLLGTAGDAPNSLYEQELQGPLALVMGAEGEGIRRLRSE